MANTDPASSPSILSVLQNYASSDAFSAQSPHPFCADPDEVVSQLKGLIDATSNISSCLNTHMTIPVLNPKLYSLLRQETAITHTVHHVTLLLSVFAAKDRDDTYTFSIGRLNCKTDGRSSSQAHRNNLQ